VEHFRLRNTYLLLIRSFTSINVLIVSNLIVAVAIWGRVKGSRIWSCRIRYLYVLYTF